MYRAKKHYSALGLTAAALLVAAANCTVENANYCDTARPCTDPTRPFCDIEGIYPESNGVNNVCIANPFDTDAGSSDTDAGADAGAGSMLAVTPAEATFATPVGTVSAAKLFSVENISTVDVSTVTVRIDNTTAFSISKNECTAALLPTGICSFEVKFTPSKVGRHTGTVTISTDDSSDVSVPLIGAGTSAALGDLRVNAWQELPLEPSFDPSTLQYASHASVITQQVIVTPTAEYEDATITVNGQTVASGQPSQPIAVSPAATTSATIVVSAENTPPRTYVVSLDATAAPTQHIRLISPDAAVGDQFGSRVAIDGDHIVVGAPGKDVGGKNSSGAVYVFELSDGEWEQQGIALTAPDAAVGDHFGESVALDGDRIVVGTPYKDVGGENSAGTAYVFALENGEWKQQGDALTASDATEYDHFGESVAIDGDRIVVGAEGNDITNAENESLSDAGAVYIFR